MSIPINTNILTHPSLIIEVPNATYPVKDSQLGIKEISLETEDLFTLETFESMMKTRFGMGLDFYVAAVKEGKKTFFFEAAKFVEYFVSKKEENPFTKEPIDDFEVFWITDGDTEFEHFAMKEYVAEYPNYLQLLWNDHTRPVSERRECICTLGIFYAKGENGMKLDIETAISLLKKAIDMGSLNAVNGLSNLYFDIDDNEKSTFWSLEALKFENATIEDYLICSGRLKEGIGIEVDLARSLELDKKVARRGNYYGLINVIRHLETNFDKHEEAKLWRAVLSENIKEKSIEGILQHYNHLGYDHEKAFVLPEELLEDPAPLAIKV